MSAGAANTAGSAQLELRLVAPSARRREGRAPAAEYRAGLAGAFLARLRAAGLRRIESCRLTRNRTVVASWRGAELRVHEAFLGAPPDVIAAIVEFVEARGAARTRARRVIVSYPVPAGDAPVRRERPHPDDVVIVERLTRLHRTLNDEHFDGALAPVAIRVSRRMRRRLGHYRPRGAGHEAEIVLSRRHIRRHGWRAATETLLHEMVHQWQEETGRPLGHGADFRRQARAVGIAPEATRRVALTLP